MPRDPNLLDKIRQRQGTTPPAAAPSAPVAADPPPPPKAKKPSPGAVATFACGHERPLAKLATQPCQGCREKAMADARRQRAERQAAKKAAQRGVWAATPTHGRLPDGSSFSVIYDAAAEQWSGSLVVLGIPATFHGSASGVKRLLADLDAQYRAAVSQRCDGELATEQE